MPTGQVTVTGKDAGAIQLTAKLFANARLITIDPISQTLHVTDPTGLIRDIDISAATVITGTIGPTALTLVIS